ncbi:hypothetical protein [Pseudomonas eucalypticola]|uniref:DUF3742 family protein n=1 Tax=Pseudomonas eucalypticola TaxID=2599595 RepID=A0A7D5H2V9_9PSED|nr:hypothetical protein [Pseudomonas eucalypticola]QKZ04162.1 hypothetical protein HWQ56_10350 [Pseudomonas eucalypticola]
MTFSYRIGAFVGGLWVRSRKAQRALIYSSKFSDIPLPVRHGFLSIATGVFIVVIVLGAVFTVCIVLGLAVLRRLPSLDVGPDAPPGYDDIDHPYHRVTYPERYDDFGSLR